MERAFYIKREIYPPNAMYEPDWTPVGGKAVIKNNLGITVEI